MTNYESFYESLEDYQKKFMANLHEMEQIEDKISAESSDNFKKHLRLSNLALQMMRRFQELKSYGMTEEETEKRLESLGIDLDNLEDKMRGVGEK